MITAAQVARGKVIHWDRFLQRPELLQADYQIVIPTFDRPDELCGNTLALLKDDGINVDRVNIFVSPVVAKKTKQPEWYRYLEACNSNGYSGVKVRPGGRNLEEQMTMAMKWAGSGYIVVMSDTVRRIRTALRQDSTVISVPSAKGTIPSLIEHGYRLMKATGCVAWSVNPSHNPRNLECEKISRKLGLLDGNLTGMLLPPNWKRLRVTKGHGLIYDVEWSAALWSNGYRFFRYRGLCCEHQYRQEGGQATLMNDALLRRQVENDAISKVSKKYPHCLQVMHKPKASLRTMEYRFNTKGPANLMMSIRKPGRKRKYHTHAPSSPAERMRRYRQRRRAVRVQR